MENTTLLKAKRLAELDIFRAQKLIDVYNQLTSQANQLNRVAELELEQLAPTMEPLALEEARKRLARFMDINLSIAQSAVRSLTKNTLN